MGDIVTTRLLRYTDDICEITDSMSRNRTAKEYFIEKVRGDNNGNTSNRAFFAEGALGRAKLIAANQRTENLIAGIEFEQQGNEETEESRDDGR